MNKLFRILGLLCVFGVSASALAVIETYEFSSPDLEARYRALSQELRCPKCQNQNIADSNAPISQDLRRLLYEELEAGASDQEILDNMVSRYGEFVRYRPSADGVTLWLWLFPALLLVVGAVFVLLLLRRREAPEPELSEDELRELDVLLGEGNRSS